MSDRTPGGIRSLTVLGGRDKQGAPERLEVTFRRGDVTSLVGPTGSGKSRFLADLEWLAQSDTPSGRRILLEGAAPDEARRLEGHRLVAQLSQNMNFVVDLRCGEFVMMHAESRAHPDPARAAREVVARANELAGEPFDAQTHLTALSGGQSRALMIAGVAHLSTAPVVVIDEIENAGIDRARALALLVAGQKIVFVATHDPIVALRASRRLVFADGCVRAVLARSAEEQAALAVLESLDSRLAAARDALRRGASIAPGRVGSSAPRVVERTAHGARQTSCRISPEPEASGQRGRRPRCGRPRSARPRRAPVTGGGIKS